MRQIRAEKSIGRERIKREREREIEDGVGVGMRAVRWIGDKLEERIKRAFLSPPSFIF